MFTFDNLTLREMDRLIIFVTVFSAVAAIVSAGLLVFALTLV